MTPTPTGTGMKRALGISAGFTTALGAGIVWLYGGPQMKLAASAGVATTLVLLTVSVLIVLWTTGDADHPRI